MYRPCCNTTMILTLLIKHCIFFFFMIMPFGLHFILMWMTLMSWNGRKKLPSIKSVLCKSSESVLYELWLLEILFILKLWLLNMWNSWSSQHVITKNPSNWIFTNHPKFSRLLSFFALAGLEQHMMKLLTTSPYLTRRFANRKFGIVRRLD
jgi:hypothetical protein